MAATLTKAQIERHIFESLMPLTGRAIVAGSIRQNNPPAPDIECVVADTGSLAVELVALDDNETRTRLRNMNATKETWFRALSGHSAPDQSRLGTECADMFLSVTIDNAAGLRDRTAIMKIIQDELLRKPPRFSGPLFNPMNLPVGLYRAMVHRGHVVNGPRISSPSAGNVLPMQVDRIRDKLMDKTYRTMSPLELFAYSIHDEVDAYANARALIDGCVNAYLPQSRFARVKVFDFGFGQLKFEYP